MCSRKTIPRSRARTTARLFLRLRSRATFLLPFLFAAAAFSETTSAPIDPYPYIDALAPSHKHPRVLTTEDLPAMSTASLRPLVAPQGDFNADGLADLAISGVYGLPDGGPRYFLLVATRRTDPIRFEALLFEESDAPHILHRAGTTGPADPGDQAFSVSSCWDCEKGFDLTWNARKRAFDRKPWKAGEIRGTRTVTVPGAPDLPEDLVDRALKIVGTLPDVQAFVAEVKDRGTELVTRARAAKPGSTDKAIVEILERTSEGEAVYDRISVDLRKERVIRRERKKKPGAKDKKR